jgi:carbon storage regulator
MLVLKRKERESIRIGSDIVISVLKAGPDNIRIGIEAPKHVRILRDELVAAPEHPILTSPCFARESVGAKAI